MAITLNGTTGITTPKLDALDLELGSKNVVERGSNANGSYVRFADGTQICYFVEAAVEHTANIDREGLWTFPAAFAAPPLSSVSLRVPVSSNIFTQLKAQSFCSNTAATTKTTFSATQGYGLNNYVIGRWF